MYSKHVNFVSVYCDIIRAVSGGGGGGAVATRDYQI